MSEVPTAERKAAMVPAVVPSSDSLQPVSGRIYTYEEVVAEFPETNQPCEIVDGELIFMAAPSFCHQEISFLLHRALFDWVMPKRLGKVISSPIDMVLSPRRVRQPDVAFIAKNRLHIVT